MAAHLQDRAYKASVDNPSSFWARQADQLQWHKKPKTVYQEYTRRLESGTSHPSWTWFPDGEISTSYNCIDRHVEAGHGDNIAIIWDSPVSGNKQKISYRELQEEVATLAGVLREQGVRKGDTVLIYMPMIPPALVAMFATVRLGAIHAVVFGGFSASSLAQRMEACNPKVILTASCGIEGAKGPISYQPMVRGAVEQSSHKPASTIVWQREQRKWSDINQQKGERDWRQLIQDAKRNGLKADNVPVRSNDGLYIIYTSYVTFYNLIRKDAG